VFCKYVVGVVVYEYFNEMNEVMYEYEYSRD
jgi:hypothetical protein